MKIAIAAMAALFLTIVSASPVRAQSDHLFQVINTSSQCVVAHVAYIFISQDDGSAQSRTTSTKTIQPNRMESFDVSPSYGGSAKAFALFANGSCGTARGDTRFSCRLAEGSTNVTIVDLGKNRLGCYAS